MNKKSALRISLVLAGLAVLIMCATSVRVMAAVDAYLKIEGIDGSSKDPGHANWIGVTRVAAGDLNGDAAADREASAPSVSEVTAHAATSGAGAGKVTETKSASGTSATAAPRDMATGMASGKRMHKPFVIVKEMDAASPKLMQACASGKHFPSVVVDMGGKQYTLYDVVIASDQKMAGGERPTESITLTYQKIEMK